MPYRFAHHLRLSFAGALFLCVLLYLTPEIPIFPLVYCCGVRMPFPLLCLGTFFSLFSIISWWYCSAHKKGDGSPFSAPSRGRWQHLSSLVFSDYLRGWFLVSLLCSTMLVLLGAALLFSLPLNFTWSALVLGCFSVLGGLLLLGGHRS